MDKIFNGNGKALAELKNELNNNPLFKGMAIPDHLVLPLINYVDDQKKCSNCKGLKNCKQHMSGYQPILGNDLRVLYKACKYLKEEELLLSSNQKIKTLYLPKKILEATIKDFRHDTEKRVEALKYLSKFVTSLADGKYEKGLYLYGEFRSGKTYLLAATANELARRNIETILIYFPDLVSDLKGNMDMLNQKIDMLKDVDVLMLDDIGSENMTPWVRDTILSPILNYRILSDKPVFFSSNLSLDDMVEYLAKSDNDKIKAMRICKRIAELCEEKTL